MMRSGAALAKSPTEPETVDQQHKVAQFLEGGSDLPLLADGDVHPENDDPVDDGVEVTRNIEISKP